MGPTRAPIRLPKITKYSVAVTIAGTSVWPQMRTMRPYSRITMVWNPIQRIAARDAGAAGGAGSVAASDMAPPVLDQPHEDLLQPIDLVAHAQHLDALQRQLREQLVQVLLLGNIGLERVVIDPSQHETCHARRRQHCVPGIEHEGLGV